MSISSVSSGHNAYQPSSTQSNFKQVRQAFGDLANALQSGDLSGSQNAFSALQQLTQGVQFGSQSQSQGNSTQNQFSTDLSAIGQALQSGDVKLAQDALTKLQQDMQAPRQEHHHHRAHGAAGATTASSSTGATDSDGSGAQAINVIA
jgi:hypothetical protein